MRKILKSIFAVVALMTVLMAANTAAAKITSEDGFKKETVFVAPEDVIGAMIPKGNGMSTSDVSAVDPTEEMRFFSDKGTRSIFVGGDIMAVGAPQERGKLSVLSEIGAGSRGHYATYHRQPGFILRC